MSRLHVPTGLCHDPVAVGQRGAGQGEQTPIQGQTLARLEGKTAMVALQVSVSLRKWHSVGC